MSMASGGDPEAELQAAAARFQAGDAAGARTRFRALAETGATGTRAWLGLAAACRALSDEAGELEALDRTLAIEPRQLRALLMKGDWMDRAGRTRQAASFYLVANNLVPDPARVPPDLQEMLRRGAARCADYAARYKTYIRERLSGDAASADEPRFALAMDILFGQARIYSQEPRRFYFPELPQIAFYEREMFGDWLRTLEAATDEIREEAEALLADPASFSPYLEATAGQAVADDHGMLGNRDWSSCHLIRNGETVAANAGRCPRTLAALADAPLDRIAGQTPSVLFSLLRPGAHIPPHNGFLNTRLICHLPLITPPDCALRVGAFTREWVQGRTLIFDDTIEHEAWNRSDQMRVVLLFDIWRPELTATERTLVTALLESIEAYDEDRA